MADIPEVLFVCVHNAGRSQMAAALLDHYAARRDKSLSVELLTSWGDRGCDDWCIHSLAPLRCWRRDWG
jgi:hypothetical protein